MKRLLITLTAAVLVASRLWAKGEDEVIVTRQLTMAQRNSLPENTIVVEMKRLVPAKKADPMLIKAIETMMDTIASEDYHNRTFVLLLEPKGNNEVTIAIRNDDIVTRGSKDATIYFGELEHERYHFVVLNSKDNTALLQRVFKRQGKVKFVQEFEFVDFITPRYPTSVIGHWSPDKGFQWKTVVINDDPNRDRDSFDRPANAED